MFCDYSLDSKAKLQLNDKDFNVMDNFITIDILTLK